MRRAAISLTISLVIVACGGPQPNPVPAKGEGPVVEETKPPAPSAGEKKSAVAPLEVHQKATREKAVILGAGADGESVYVPLPSSKETENVDVLYYKRSRGKASGGMTPVKLNVEPGDRENVSVGVFEQYSGGLGAQSRASVWIAAFRAAGMLGRDLTDFRFSAEVGGFVDGPSAGALITAGYLAGLTGAPIDAEATMTGTINPDGTVGPVGGIPHKFAGAIEKGKKRLGYPLGMRMSQDMNTGRMVDLETLAKDKGAVAMEISDVYDAYKLLTGKELPRPRPIDEKAMELSGSISYRLEKARDQVAASRAKVLGGIESSKLPTPPTVAALMETSQRETNLGNREATDGKFASAYQRAVESHAHSLAAQYTGELVAMSRKGEWSQLRGQLSGRVRALEAAFKSMEGMGSRHPDSIGGHLLLISAFEGIIESIGFGVWAMDDVPRVMGMMRRIQRMKAGTERDEALAALIAPALVNVARSETRLAAVEQLFTIQASETINYSCSEPAARKLAESYSSAAIANFRYFESILLKQIQQMGGMSEGRARRYLGKIEPDYVAAAGATRIALGQLSAVAKLKDKWGEDSLPWSLQTLAGATMSYFKSSLLISRYYSLGVQKDRRTGRAIRIKHKKALGNMLETARRGAREHATAARLAVGHVPVQSKLSYQMARVLENGSIDDKLRALESYWASSSFSQTAVAMATHVINPKKHGAFGR